MADMIAALSTNLFRTYIIRRFMKVFFQSEIENRRKEIVIYMLFYVATVGVYLRFHYPPANVAVNLVLLYLITQLYKGSQKKKILVALLVYGINMFCDILAAYSCYNYVYGEETIENVAYITIFLIAICEFVVERALVKNREKDSMPLAWNLLVTIPIISIVILMIITMNNLNNRIILISVSTGILLINLLLFYMYDVLTAAYLKLEESVMFERQLASYANQLKVLTQSEKKVSALRHDLKHHFIELLSRTKEEDLIKYIHTMQKELDYPQEYIRSGNKEIDSVLNYMLEKAKKTLKKVEYKADVPEKIDISDFDLNIIMGNLLDNAILAAQNSEEKSLSISMRYEKSMLFICVKNSYSGVLQKKKEIYVSTKQGAGTHGIGLQNVRRVVERYNGSMNISDEKGIFDVKIMLYTMCGE